MGSFTWAIQNMLLASVLEAIQCLTPPKKACARVRAKFADSHLPSAVMYPDQHDAIRDVQIAHLTQPMYVVT